MMPLLLLSDTRRVREGFVKEVQTHAPVKALILDGAGPDHENRGGSAAEIYAELGIATAVCDPLTERLPDLEDFDLVHMSGGNPFRLLLGARRQGLKEKLTSGRDKLLVGVSAGAMVLGTDIRHANILQPDLGITDTSGFGFVPYPVMPHMDLNGRYGEVIRNHVEQTPMNWLLLQETSLVSYGPRGLHDLKEKYDAQTSFGWF